MYKEFKGDALLHAVSPVIPQTENAYRPDIDGLRAIAVTSVVLYHAGLTQLASGFVGVDIFFAISGYLIGGIIYSEVVQDRFSFADFYARRARRILPALFAVILTICALGLLLLSSSELVSLGEQAVAAMIGLPNIYFWTDAGYFAESSHLKPLLMTWSLGVEEQFYILLPLIIFLNVKFNVRYRVIFLLSLCLLSLFISLFLTTRSNASAFYLLPPRAWEMGAGAALAIIHQVRPHSTEGKLARNSIFAFVGILLLAGAITLLKDVAFPGFAAVIPIVGTLILLHSRHSAVNGKILGNRMAVYIGLISYSWYLWHWPLMALLWAASDVDPPLPTMLGIAALSLVMAIGSRRWIEAPFRAAKATSRVTLRRYGVALGAVVAVPVAFVLGNGVPSRLAANARSAEAVMAEGRSRECLLGFADAIPKSSSGCFPKNATIALYGDSHSAALSPGLIVAAERQGQSVRHYSKSSCAPLSGISNPLDFQPKHMASCLEFNDRAIAQIAEDAKIHTVVVSGSFPALSDRRYVRRDDVDRLIDTELAWREGLGTVIDRFRATGKRVIVIGDVPRFAFNPMRHHLTGQIPARLWIAQQIGTYAQASGGQVNRNDLLPGYAEMSSRVRSIALAHGAEWLDIAEQLCGKSTCSYSFGQTPLFFDDHHLSTAGARMIKWPSL